MPDPELADDPTMTDPARPCVMNVHHWPLLFVYGDTCNCGDFYLMQAPDGHIYIEERHA